MKDSRLESCDFSSEWTEIERLQLIQMISYRALDYAGDVNTYVTYMDAVTLISTFNKEILESNRRHIMEFAGIK